MNLIKYYHELHEIPSQTYCHDYMTNLITNKETLLFSCLSLSIDELDMFVTHYETTTINTLLLDVANRLKAILRSNDILCQNEKNEFTLILKDLDQLKDQEKIISRIMAMFQSPFYVNQKPILLSAYIGISHFPEHNTDINKLIQYANIAMYFSKNTSKNTYTVFNDNMTQNIAVKDNLINELEVAIKEKQFRIYYQPIINTSNKTVDSAEALLRWQHPKKIVVLPRDYLLVAKETGLIVSIEKWILSEVFQQLHLWDSQSSMRVSISINVSKQFLSDTNFIEYLNNMTSLYNIHPQLITFEISEDTLLEDHLILKSNLESITQLGFSLCLDNFNANFSSLKLLNNKLISKIKISKHFIEGIHNNTKDEALIQMLTSLAKALNLEIIALGVENINQINFLNNIFCHKLQGYYFSAPLENSDFEKYVSEKNID